MIFVSYTKIENNKAVYDYTFFSDWGDLFKWLFSFNVDNREIIGNNIKFNIITCRDEKNKITYFIEKVINDEGIHFERFRHISGEFSAALKKNVQFHKR